MAGADTSGLWWMRGSRGGVEEGTAMNDTILDSHTHAQSRWSISGRSVVKASATLILKVHAHISSGGRCRNRWSNRQSAGEHPMPRPRPTLAGWVTIRGPDPLRSTHRRPYLMDRGSEQQQALLGPISQQVMEIMPRIQCAADPGEVHVHNQLVLPVPSMANEGIPMALESHDSFMKEGSGVMGVISLRILVGVDGPPIRHARARHHVREGHRARATTWLTWHSGLMVLSEPFMHSGRCMCSPVSF